MSVLDFLNLPDDTDPDSYHAALKASMAQLEGQFGAQASISGTATGGSATTLTDTGLSLGTNVYANGVLIVWRAGVVLRSEKVTSNTAAVVTIPTGTAIAAGDTYGLYVTSNGILLSEKAAANGVASLDASTQLIQRLSYEGAASGVPTLDVSTAVVERLSYEGVASGVATLDANIEVVELPAGAAAAAAIDPTAILRADGSWQTLNGGQSPAYSDIFGPALTTLVSDALTKITGWTATNDPYASKDTTEGIIIPADLNGRIMVFSAEAMLDAGAEYGYAEIRLNGSIIAHASTSTSASSSRQIALNFSTRPKPVATGDIINLYVKQYDVGAASIGLRSPSLGMYQVGASS